MSDEDCQRLVEWAQPYENNWPKHENLDYLKTFEFPILGHSIDAFGGVVERITAVLERQKHYVHRHTEILAIAFPDLVRMKIKGNVENNFSHH